MEEPGGVTRGVAPRVPGRDEGLEGIETKPRRRARAAAVAVPELERLEWEIRQRVAGAT